MAFLAAIVGALALAQSGALSPKPSPEAWADPRLTVRDGLAVWIDVSRQAQAYDAAGRDVPADGGPLGVAYDASGFRRDAQQRVRAMQPRFLAAGTGALLRFDGVDDALVAAGIDTQLHEFTLLVRAAPRSNAGGFRGLVSFDQTGRNDYRSGFTLDLTWAPTPRLEVVNVEGAGFGGAVALPWRTTSDVPRSPWTRVRPTSGCAWTATNRRRARTGSPAVRSTS
jgi:hypothetical protein